MCVCACVWVEWVGFWVGEEIEGGCVDVVGGCVCMCVCECVYGMCLSMSVCECVCGWVGGVLGRAGCGVCVWRGEEGVWLWVERARMKIVIIILVPFNLLHIGHIICDTVYF